MIIINHAQTVLPVIMQHPITEPSAADRRPGGYVYKATIVDRIL